jgi:prophage regulatory protein
MQDRFVTMQELPGIVGVCPRSIAYLREEGRFPKPRKLTSKRIGWLESEVLEWMRARPVVGANAD